MARRALVTGSSGFLARHLIRALRAAGDTHILGADVRAGDEPVDAFIATDMLDAHEVANLVRSAAPDEAYHLVGATRAPDLELQASNVGTATHLLDAIAGAAPACRAVLLGSAAEYGATPADGAALDEDAREGAATPYGEAKRMVTALAQDRAARGLSVSVARPFNPVGAGVPESLVAGALISRLRGAAATGGTITVGDTRAIRDFVDAGEVGAGLIATARKGRSGQAYNLASGRGVPVQSVLDILLGLAGGDVVVRVDPSLLRPGEVSRSVGATAKAARELGWRATRPLAESLREAWNATAPAGTAR